MVVHDCSSTNLSLAGKNFSYETIPFGDFMGRIVHGEKLYLRSLSYENAGRQAANLTFDYPSLSRDFQLSPVLDYVKANFHSSVLRICGPVNMGLHYDVRYPPPLLFGTKWIGDGQYLVPDRGKEDDTSVSANRYQSSWHRARNIQLAT